MGAVTLLGQVVLLRELSVAFHGSELVTLLALAGWLLGSGLGAGLGRRRATAAPLLLRWMLLAYATLLPGGAMAARALRQGLGAIPGGELPLPWQLLGASLVLLPCALLAGALFRVGARVWLGPGRSLVQAYGLESAGALLGGILSSGLVLVGMGNLALALITSLLAVATAALPGSGERRWLHGITLTGAVLGVLLLAGSGPLDRALTTLEHPSLLDSRDTPYGRVTVEQRYEQAVVYLNGALVHETQGVDPDAFVHSAALQVENPRRVLLLGGASQGLLPPLLQHRPERVDLVEPDAALLALLRQRLPDAERTALANPAVTIHIQDPRRFLAQLGRYDLILVAQPPPASVAASRTWTREFYALCAEHLTPGGVLAFRLAGAENLWTPTLTWRNAGIHRALLHSFDDVLVLPGKDNLWLASRGGLERNSALLGRRLVARVIRSDLISEAYLDYQLNNDRTAEIARLLEDATAPANTDDRPSATTATLLLWLGRFHPRLALRDPAPFAQRAQTQAPLYLVTLGLLLWGSAAVTRRRPGTRRVALALLAGLLGTLLESVLLLRFQLQHGVLYGHLGLLLAAFMAGLAAGALGLDAVSRRLADDGPTPRWLNITVGVTALLTSGAVWLSPTPDPSHSAALLLASGASTAALFGLATRTGQPDPAQVAGSLYGLDLLGGCVGVLLATAVLAPLMGLSITAASAIVVAVAVLVLVL